MNEGVMIPQGEKTITVELTLKEAMALTGYRFNQNPKQHANASGKVKKALDTQLIGEPERPLHYEEIIH